MALALLALLPLAAGCDSGGSSTTEGSTSSGGQPPAASLYGPSIGKIVFEVDYAAGAEPYTGTIPAFGEVWGLFDKNARRLFEGAEKEFEIPTSLDAMQAIGDVPGESFTAEAILDLAAKHRDKPSSGDTASFYFLWLNGLYHDGKEVNGNVLGVSIGTTGVIAMFKPVIAGTASPLPGLDVEKYVEQATAIHEFGHAAGLVDNGLAMANPHKDEANGAHCSNQDCIMYYAIEGTSGVVDFVKKSVISSDVTLWGAECLGDAEAAIP